MTQRMHGLQVTVHLASTHHEASRSCMFSTKLLSSDQGMCVAYLHILRGFLKSYLDTLDSVGLSTAHTQQPLLLGNCDGITLDVLHTSPGKGKVSQLLLCWLCLRHRGEGDAIWP